MKIKNYKQIFYPSDIKNNKLQLKDRAFHDWYRFVLSFPPHLVREYIINFELNKKSILLDPFCGTGTTLVEAKKNGISSIGIEAIPMAYLASKVKTTWNLDTEKIRKSTRKIYNIALEIHNKDKHNLRTFNKDQNAIILKNSISNLPLHKCLVLLEAIFTEQDKNIRDFCLLALAYISVYSASNLKFGPEVGIGKKIKHDASVFEDWLGKINLMIYDLESITNPYIPPTTCLNLDSRNLRGSIANKTIDAIITSPPYPNEKDYTRTTRLESTILGFIKNKNDLRKLKEGLIRSNTRNVYVSDKDDIQIPSGSKVDLIAKEIERRRIALKKTSGFEKQYHRVTRLYFGGMRMHLLEIQPLLKSGAKLAYVIGDQASYLQVLIRTGEILADIAHEIGYKVLGIDLFRTRLSTTTGKYLREEILLLEWKRENKIKGKLKMIKKPNRYDKLIERAFFNNYKKGANEITFDREEFESIAKELGIKLPKNLGDIIYSYRYRIDLPESITNLLDKGEEWIIRSVGKGKYQFSKSAIHRIFPNPRLTKIKILDSTPEIIRRYALNDEQALLAILRYNRLIDIFLGVTCYSLQSHLRTTVPGIGQVETDELYVGINKRGEQYIVPVQAKGKTDQLGIVQIEQDFAISEEKFPALICRPVAAQFIEDNLIALFEFEKNEGEITIKEEKHYRIVPNDMLTDEEIKSYIEK